LKVVNFPVGFNSRPKAQFLLEPFIEEASDGEEAVELVTKVRPHVALMDIVVPRVNGFKATIQIEARYPATAVLILTAYDDDQYIFTLLLEEGYRRLTALLAAIANSESLI